MTFKSDKDIKSSKLAELIRYEIDCGNSIESIEAGWSKIDQAIFLKNPMQEASKRLASEANLRVYTSEASPHAPADEGIVDDAASVLVSFPARQGSFGLL